MNYKLTLNPECVFRISDSVYITKCESNSSWDEYEKWLSEGNTPLPADLPPAVPAPEPEVVPTPEPEVVPIPEPEVVPAPAPEPEVTPAPEQETPAP